jgi:hypothetical protein
MNNKILTIPNAGRMTCVWIPTGDAKMPLARVWVKADAPQPASVAPSYSNDETGGLGLCA